MARAVTEPAKPRGVLGPGEAVLAGTATTHPGPLEPITGEERTVTRTYRVQVTGQLADLTPTVRAQLRAEQAEHDLFLAAFTPEGTFTYSPTLTRFTLRYLLEVSEDSAAEADQAAAVEGELPGDPVPRGSEHHPQGVDRDGRLRGRRQDQAPTQQAMSGDPT